MKYRIVRDYWAGYEVQKKVWWWPWWTKAGGTNTHHSVAQARTYAHTLMSPVIEIVTPPTSTKGPTP